ncbi:MAG: transcriptional regulator [Paenibacillus sp.]|nr:transcriptional regulator [Paenibacillus sp.]
MSTAMPPVPEGTPDHFMLDLELGPILFHIDLDSGFYNPEYEWKRLSHNHAAFELQYILQGSVTLYIHDTHYVLREGCYCLIPPFEYHSQMMDPEQPVLKTCFRFTYEMLPDARHGFPESESRAMQHIVTNLTFFIQRDCGADLALITAVQKELLTRPVGYFARMQCLLGQILLGVMRSTPNVPAVSSELPNLTLDSQRMSIIDEFFVRNLNEEIKEAELASLLKVSSRQLNRIMKRLYHTSFRQKLVKTRMNVAMDLLKNTDAPVSEILLHVGYKSTENFYANFKSYTGLTPSAFRKREKQTPSLPDVDHTDHFLSFV